MESLVSEVARSLNSIALTQMQNPDCEITPLIENALLSGNWVPLRIIAWCCMNARDDFDHIAAIIQMTAHITTAEYQRFFVPGIMCEIGALIARLTRGNFAMNGVSIWARKMDEHSLMNECKNFLMCDSRRNFEQFTDFVTFMQTTRFVIINANKTAITRDDKQQEGSIEYIPDDDDKSSGSNSKTGSTVKSFNQTNSVVSGHAPGSYDLSSFMLGLSTEEDDEDIY